MYPPLDRRTLHLSIGVQSSSCYAPNGLITKHIHDYHALLKALHEGATMSSDSGQSTSLWMDVEIPSFAPLAEDIKTDVCVIGAGIAGLTVAYLLAREGKSVVVLDDGPIGGGESGRTTAHLASAIDDRYFEIERIHGPKAAHLAYTSHSSAIDLIEKIVKGE